MSNELNSNQSNIISNKSTTDKLTSNELSSLTDQIRLIFSKITNLPLDEIDADKTFSELGMDSILGFEFVEVMKEQFDCSMSTSILYKYIKISRLAEYLQTNMDELKKKKILD